MSRVVHVIGNGDSAAFYQKEPRKGLKLTCNIPPFEVKAYATCIVDFKMMKAIDKGEVTLGGEWIVGARPKEYCARNPKFHMKIAHHIKEFYTKIPKYAPNYTDFNCGMMAVYYAAEKCLINEDIHSIIATGDPFILFQYAQILSKKFNIPWIADYRDPWSQDIPLQKKYFLKKWSNYNEKKLLKSVSSVITVSQFVADKIALNYSNKKINIIPNGFDPEIINNISKITQNSEKLTISYAGTIYNWHPIEIFFKSLNEFLRLHSEVELKLNFYGINNQNDIHDKLVKFPYAKKCIEFHPRIPNEQLLKTLAESNVLLLFNYYSFMGTKIYDYLGLQRKILFCFTADENALILKDKYYKIDEKSNLNKELQSDLIKESESGVLVKNADHLKEVLMDIFLEFKQTKKIKCESKNVSQFSREFRVKELADLIGKNISSHS